VAASRSQWLVCVRYVNEATARTIDPALAFSSRCHCALLAAQYFRCLRRTLGQWLAHRAAASGCWRGVDHRWLSAIQLVRQPIRTSRQRNTRALGPNQQLSGKGTISLYPEPDDLRRSADAAWPSPALGFMGGGYLGLRLCLNQSYLLYAIGRARAGKTVWRGLSRL